MATEAFRGEFYQKVDSKARVSIPASLRRILELEDPGASNTQRARVNMVYGGAGRNFVECYSMNGARDLNFRIQQLPMGSKEREKAELTFITRSTDVEIDEDGRLVLPAKVRAKMGVTVDDLAKGFAAAFAGRLERFQLWKGDTYDAIVVAADEDGDDDLLNGQDPLILLKNTTSGV
ncbi:MAG: division/cell wall cluster transcriptional repressor MraZ [Paracoccaceae bacterium]